MSRKKDALNRFFFGLYHASTKIRPYRFNIPSLNNSKNDNDDGVHLLSVRFIPSTEDLHWEFSRCYLRHFYLNICELQDILRCWDLTYQELSERSIKEIKK